MKEKFHLSELDKRIISEIQQDATLSAAELARRTASSPATCWRRIKAMEEAGVLGPTVRLVNPAAVGRGMDAFCNVRMKSQDATSRRAFLRAMEQEQAITEVYSISGEWDYLLHFVVRGMDEVEDILMRRVLDHDNVAGTSTIFVLRRVKHTTQVPV